MAAVLITGAAVRVGAVLARGLARAGYDIALHYNRSTAPAEAVAADIRALGRKAGLVQADLENGPEAEDLVDKSAKLFPDLAAVINNASLFRYDEGRSFTLETWDRQMNVNLRAPALITKRFAQHIETNDITGCIINILDQKVFNPQPEFFSYTVSKTALERLTHLSAIEYAPKLRVNGIAPGLTLPSGTQSQAQFEATHSNTLLGRGSTPEAILDAALYLMSNEVVTGQVLYVDGGEHLQPRRNYQDMIE